jgi:hypothetical protein
VRIRLEDPRLVSHGSTKKDRKTKEFPRIEGWNKEDDNG